MLKSPISLETLLAIDEKFKAPEVIVEVDNTVIPGEGLNKIAGWRPSDTEVVLSEEYWAKGTVNGKNFHIRTPNEYLEFNIKKQNPHLSDDEAEAVASHTDTDEFVNGSDGETQHDIGGTIYKVKVTHQGGHMGEEPSKVTAPPATPPKKYDPRQAYYDRMTPAARSGLAARRNHQFSSDIGGSSSNYRESFEVFDLTGIETLLEGGGNLSDLPPKVMKIVTKREGGENSNVTNHGRATSLSKLHGIVSDAIKNYPSATHVLLKNGKHVAAIVQNKSYTDERPNHTVTEPESGKNYSVMDRTKVSGTGRWISTRAGGHYIPVEYRDWARDELTKRETHDKIENILKQHADKDEDHTSKEHFKNNEYTVKSYHPDAERVAKHTARVENRPYMQTNYKKKTPEEMEKYGDSRENVISTTPSGIKGLRAITDTAAKKLAVKHLGNLESPKSKALELHSKLGDLIKSGANSGDIALAAAMLGDHIRKHGSSEENFELKSHADDLKDLRSNSYDKNRAKHRIKDRLAKYGVKSESVLSEISKPTLQKYQVKAANDLADTGHKMGHLDATRDEVDRFTNRHMADKFNKNDELKAHLKADNTTRENLRQRLVKRINGIKLAGTKLTKPAKGS